jgi:hypothetical protein
MLARRQNAVGSTLFLDVHVIGVEVDDVVLADLIAYIATLVTDGCVLIDVVLTKLRAADGCQAREGPNNEAAYKALPDVLSLH